jgi:hypothetical protein
VSNGVDTDATTASSNNASSKPSKRIARLEDSPPKKEKVTSS